MYLYLQQTFGICRRTSSSFRTYIALFLLATKLTALCFLQRVCIKVILFIIFLSTTRLYQYVGLGLYIAIQLLKDSFSNLQLILRLTSCNQESSNITSQLAKRRMSRVTTIQYLLMQTQAFVLCVITNYSSIILLDATQT